MPNAYLGFGEVYQSFVIASFPGPAQLSVAISMEKRERAWYLFSHEHDVTENAENF